MSIKWGARSLRLNLERRCLIRNFVGRPKPQEVDNRSVASRFAHPKPRRPGGQSLPSRSIANECSPCVSDRCEACTAACDRSANNAGASLSSRGLGRQVSTSRRLIHNVRVSSDGLHPVARWPNIEQSRSGDSFAAR
eukprot:9491525-Pyramimonas_sp.AAC.1